MTKEICLVFDTEADFYYYIPSPHASRLGIIKWKINKILGKIYRYPWPASNGLKNLVYFFKKKNIKANFCISGFLYGKEPPSKEEIEKIRPENPWYHDKIGKDWYYFLKNKKNLPLLGDFIEKEIKSCPLFELGFHGFTHEALTLEPKDKINAIINQCFASASKIGVKPKIFAAPFNMIEDVNDPMKVFSALEEYGIKYVQYSGKDNLLTNLHGKHKVNMIENRGKVKLIRADIYFEATNSHKKMLKILNKLEQTKQDKILIVSHDFTWKNMRNLNMLIKFAKSKNIKFIKMSEYAS